MLKCFLVWFHGVVGGQASIYNVSSGRCPGEMPREVPRGRLLGEGAHGRYLQQGVETLPLPHSQESLHPPSESEELVLWDDGFTILKNVTLLTELRTS